MTFDGPAPRQRARTLTATAILTALAAFAQPAAGQAAATAPSGSPEPAPVFAALEGSWTGEGMLMGRPAAFELTWAVEGGLATLHFENAFAGEDGGITPLMAAAAVYRTTPARAEGVWLDSRGVRFELAWEVEGDALVVRWTGTEEAGRTMYRVTGRDALEVVDEVETPEGRREFGRATYERRTDAGHEGTSR